MILINAMQEITAWFPNMTHGYDSVLELLWKLPTDSIVVAQSIKDPNILANLQKAFNHFIQSGQAWALLIGLIIGYMLRSLTTYG